MKMMIPLLCFLSVVMTTPILGSDDLISVPIRPVEISGRSEGTIINNSGDPYGAEFSKVIRLDVYEKLQKNFSKNLIPQTSPLYQLRSKMPAFKNLLDDHHRVYAVKSLGKDRESLKDIYGNDVLARVVPQRFTIHSKSQNKSDEFFAITLDNVKIKSTSSSLILPLTESDFYQISFDNENYGIVQVGADFLDRTGQSLPPGFKFYSKCSDKPYADLQANDSKSVRILCNGYRLDGAVATLDGFLDVRRDEMNNLVVSGEMTIVLELQNYVIEVDRTQFEKHLKTRGSRSLQILVFHEYLRMLGIDDQGYKVSTYIRDLDKTASDPANLVKEPTFDVGDEVFIAKGVGTLAVDERSEYLPLNAPERLNPISYRGKVEAIVVKKFRLQKMPFVYEGTQFHVIDQIVSKKVVKVRAIDQSQYVSAVQYFWWDDVSPSPFSTGK